MYNFGKKSIKNHTYHAYRYEKREPERNDDPCQEHNEAHVSRILKVGQLHFTGPELHSPPFFRISFADISMKMGICLKFNQC